MPQSEFRVARTIDPRPFDVAVVVQTLAVLAAVQSDSLDYEVPPQSQLDGGVSLHAQVLHDAPVLRIFGFQRRHLVAVPLVLFSYQYLLAVWHLRVQCQLKSGQQPAADTDPYTLALMLDRMLQPRHLKTLGLDGSPPNPLVGKASPSM